MDNTGYLKIILCLFGAEREKYLISLCGKSDKTLDTKILSYLLYKYNILPYCVAVKLDSAVMNLSLSEIEKLEDNDIDKSDISITGECKIFIDKFLQFWSNECVTNAPNKTDLSCHYMTYLLLTDSNFLGNSIFVSALDKVDLNSAINSLESELVTAYGIPTDKIFQDFGRFLTNPFSNTLSNCYGRDEEISDIVDVLSRKKKNNAVLIGQPGVGKTAIVEGLAHLLMSTKCPKQFKGYHIYELRVSAIIAGTKFRGDFEERLEKLLKALTVDNNKIILFIDEIHTIFTNNKNGESKSSSDMSASDILKPYLARSHFKILGATTEKEFKIIERDGALMRRLCPIRVKEPSDDTVKHLLELSLDDYANHFNIDIASSLVSDIIYYANNYITNRYMPDKAFDLIDASCVHCINHTDKTALDTTDIIKATEMISGIKIPSKSNHLNANVKSILDYLSNCVVGQDEAIQSLSSVIKRYFLGLKSNQRPIGSFLFVGATGVGKTQLCKELANSMFTRESFIRFDMSEYMEAHAVAKLIGSPPGYVGYGEGGKLTNAVKNNPYSVVLFDEIEKAHKDIYNILLQILDDGCLTDSEGITVNFSNCIIILTSNVGVAEISESSKCAIGFSNDNEKSNSFEEKQYMSAIQKRFAPEFINRLDKIVYFNSLSKDDIRIIIDKELDILIDKFNCMEIKLKLSDVAKDKLYEKCFSQKYGARYAKKLVTSEIEDMVVDYLLSNDVIDTDILIDLSNDKLICKHIETIDI